jgi:hypothetical protein
MSEKNETGFVAGWTKAIAEMPMRGPDLVAYMDRDDAPSEADAMTAGEEFMTPEEERLAELTTLAPICDSVEAMRGAEELGWPTRLNGTPMTLEQSYEAARRDRDPKPPNTPLAIGSTWTGPDGTVYDVVAPGDVGGRPRWFVAAHLVEAYNRREGWVGPREPMALHGDDATAQAAFAFVYRAPQPASGVRQWVDEAASMARAFKAAQAKVAAIETLATELAATEGVGPFVAQEIRNRIAAADVNPPASELDTLRGRVGELEREARERHSAMSQLAAGNLQAASAVEALRLELGESQSQLASAHAACEASRNERDRLREAFLEIARETGAHADVIPSVLSDHAVTVIRHDAAVRARISSLVASHIVRATEAEPALEGLGRIEEYIAFKKGQFMGQRIARLRAANKRLRAAGKPKPARKAKPGKRRKARS